jgi:hypothetical protein
MLLDRLGGPPGRYAVTCVALSALWFPFRLLFDRGDPIAEIVAASGMQGALWALIPVFLNRPQWHARRGATDPAENRQPVPTPEGIAWARRGAFLGMAAGVPFAGVLLVVCLSTGREWAFTVFFGLLLVIIVAVAVRSLRRAPVADSSR